jgi:anti-sigma factor RsiW
MNCGSCRDLLLEADPGVIRSALTARAPDLGPAGRVEVEDELARHLATCSECAHSAERILAANDDLAAGLALLGPERGLEDAVRAASREDVPRRQVRRTPWAVAAAVAAGILAIRFLGDGPGFDSSGIDGGATPVARAEAFTPEVDVPAGESVMVMESANEDVVVFWFYQGRGE